MQGIYTFLAVFFGWLRRKHIFFAATRPPTSCRRENSCAFQDDRRPSKKRRISTDLLQWVQIQLSLAFERIIQHRVYQLAIAIRTNL